eukprot:3099071-Rhodomonas_salina.1
MPSAQPNARRWRTETSRGRELRHRVASVKLKTLCPRQAWRSWMAVEPAARSSCDPSPPPPCAPASFRRPRCARAQSVASPEPRVSTCACASDTSGISRSAVSRVSTGDSKYAKEDTRRRVEA